MLLAMRDWPASSAGRVISGLHCLRFEVTIRFHARRRRALFSRYECEYRGGRDEMAGVLPDMLFR